MATGRYGCNLTFFNGAIAGTVTNLNASGPIRIHAIALLNTTAAVAYLQMFDTVAANVTLGTTTPKLSIGLPANGGISLPFPDGFMFGTDKVGSSIAGTTTPTGLTGAAIAVNVIYGG